LASIERLTQTADSLLTVQQHFELTAQWCAMTSDIHFLGRIPAFEFTEQDREALHKQDSIQSTLSFEFFLSPARLVSPINQLRCLLEHLQTLRPNP
jgi:hypothetical protein